MSIEEDNSQCMIYFDHNATTPMLRKRDSPGWTDEKCVGNPSTPIASAARADAASRRAAALATYRVRRVACWTSGATESNNTCCIILRATFPWTRSLGLGHRTPCVMASTKHYFPETSPADSVTRQVSLI